MKNPIKLNDISTVPTEKITEAKAKKDITHLIERLSTIQNKLYAQRKYAVLIVLQGMDTAGKDSAVKHVFSGVNPAGCNVKSYKVPTPEEAAHHFLWRIAKVCPEKGMTQIFNRSHYEDILMPIINKTLNDDLIKERCEEINVFERGLLKDNTLMFKFYLHVSHKEQLKRLKDRKTDEHKRWKYQKADIIAIAKHDEYVKAYEFVFEHCSEDVPWNIVPADKKWYKNHCILHTIVKGLEKYDIHYPHTEL
ncbi:MAG TPA: PPK2 family polyphosphate kinase [Bacteroidia bacterium]